MGDLRRFSDTLSPPPWQAAYRFTCLGDPHRAAPLELPSDSAGELVRRKSRSRAISWRLSAPLPRQVSLSQHLGNGSKGCRLTRLRPQSCVLRTADVDCSQSP